jgi:hypothetical protein
MKVTMANAMDGVISYQPGKALDGGGDCGVAGRRPPAAMKTVAPAMPAASTNAMKERRQFGC